MHSHALSLSLSRSRFFFCLTPTSSNIHCLPPLAPYCHDSTVCWLTCLELWLCAPLGLAPSCVVWVRARLFAHCRVVCVPVQLNVFMLVDARKWWCAVGCGFVDVDGVSDYPGSLQAFLFGDMADLNYLSHTPGAIRVPPNFAHTNTTRCLFYTNKVSSTSHPCRRFGTRMATKEPPKKRGRCACTRK
jgi:hypothetical protein